MAALTFTRNALHKAEIEYHGKCGHIIGRIKHISLMVRLDICYTTCSLSTKVVAPALPFFQGIKRYSQCLASHPHKPIFNPYNSYYGSNFIILTCSGNQVEYHTTHNCL